MEHDRHKKKFEDWVFDTFKDCHNYDKLTYYINRARNILITENPVFEKLSFEDQKDMVITVYMMVMSGKRGSLNEVSLFNKRSPDENIQKYDIEYNYQKPSYIQVFDKDNAEVKLIEII